uniref:PAS domain-containing protein n=1 Tax=Streptomyces sp. TRM64462 TaxID=2741726 RepID=UPI0015869B9C
MSSRPSRGAARLAAILDALPDGLVLVNTNGTVVNANTIALEMFETPGTALVGRGLLDLLPAFDSRLIPGSMRRPEAADAMGRTKPARMVARRTDGSEFPVEVTSASLEDGREAYASYGGGSGSGSGYSGDELLMLVVRDLSGTIDTEAELARSQRQTEMILRAASEGVVGTDTDGRIVLVNPAAAQILGWRASDLGGKELHQLMLHSRADGEPFPYEESPLADTLGSGRKHRVRGQVVWAKDGSAVPVDLTTAPVRDGDQLVGAVMTFADRRPYEQLVAEHAAEVAELAEKHAAEIKAYEERLADAAERYDALAARHAQLTAVLGESLRGPLVELRHELRVLAADPAGQLWPEANQILHHLAAGYARMTTLVDNVLGYQRLDGGDEELRKELVLLDAVVAAGVEGAVELIGPGRVQFAVHAPPIEAEVDGVRLATALAHLAADVAGVDSTGRSRVVADGGYVDSTIVVAAAQRGDVVRIEVRGPYAGGDPVHEPIVRGIVRAHGGVLQTHEVPGMSGSAYVLELPLGVGSGAAARPAAEGGEEAAKAAAGSGSVSGAGAGAGVEAVDAAVPAPVPASASAASASASASASAVGAAVAVPAQQSGDTAGSGRRRARRASTDAFLDSPVRAEDPVAAEPTGRRRARGAGQGDTGEQRVPAQDGGLPEPTGRRRGRPSPAEAAPATPPAEGSVVTAAESAQARPVALGDTVPPQGVAPQGEGAAVPAQSTGRRARRSAHPEGAVPALPAGPANPSGPVTAPGPAATPGPVTAAGPVPPQGAAAGPVPPHGTAPQGTAAGPVPPHGTAPQGAAAGPVPPHGTAAGPVPPQGTAPQPAPTGRRARRALATAPERPAPEAQARAAFALPPAEADRTPPADAQVQSGGPQAQATGLPAQADGRSQGHGEMYGQLPGGPRTQTVPVPAG